MTAISLLLALNKPNPDKCKHNKGFHIMKDADGLVTVRRCKRCGKDCRNELH